MEYIVLELSLVCGLFGFTYGYLMALIFISGREMFGKINESKVMNGYLLLTGLGFLSAPIAGGKCELLLGGLWLSGLISGGDISGSF